MEKTIIADNKKIVLKTNGLIPLLYKKEFGKDFFEDAVKLTEKTIDCEIAYNFIWLFAKTANESIPPLWDWLASFDVFPVADFVKVIVEMVSACIYSKKKQTTPREKRVRNS